jgi:hypothetical protein
VVAPKHAVADALAADALALSDPSVPQVGVLREWITGSYRAVAPKSVSKRPDDPGGSLELGQR